MKRKVLSVMLSIVMIAAVMPVVTFAEISGEGTVASPWQIGAGLSDTVTAYFDDGFLEISGNGDMADFTEGNQPWAGKNIYSVYINDTVTSIGANAFNGFNTITSVTMYSGITKIGDYAFKDLSTNTITPFKVITIPGTVTSIGTGAFAGCDKLSKVTLLSNTPAEIGDGAFPASSKLIVPLSAVANYQDKWSSYSGAIAAACSVNLISTTGGKISVMNNGDIYSGDTITLRLLADAHYKYKEGSLVVSNKAGTTQYPMSHPTMVTDNNIQYIQYTFTMPAADVIVSAQFVKDENAPAPTKYVCKIGTRKYETLTDAVDKVKYNQTITLLTDTDEEIVVKRAVKFKIDCNGHINSSHIVGGIFTVVDAKASTKNEDVTIYTVSLKPISKETIGSVVNKLLQDAEPVIKIVIKTNQVINEISDALVDTLKRLFK